MQHPATTRPEPLATPARRLAWRLALLVAGCLLAFAAATHWLLLAPAGDALAEARLEATVGRARADAQLRLNSIEAQLLAARLADPPAAPDDADTVSGLAATLAGADGAISAVHRLDQDGRGLTLVRAPGGWRPTRHSRDTPPPWLAAALGARGGSPVGWIASIIGAIIVLFLYGLVTKRR